MIVTQRKLREGYKLPAWYGMAYYEPETRTMVCYPIFFHWLMRWGRQLWWMFLMPRAKTREEKRWEALLDNAFTEGYTQGRIAEQAHLKELAEGELT